MRQMLNGDPSGSWIGCVGEKLAFYGATPIVKPTSANEAAVPTTAIDALVTSTATEADISTTVNLVITQVAAQTVLLNQLRSDLVSLGLIAGA